MCKGTCTCACVILGACVALWVSVYVCPHVCVCNARVCMHVYVLMCVGMGSSAQGSVKGIAADLGLQWAWGTIGKSTFSVLSAGMTSQRKQPRGWGGASGV